MASITESTVQGPGSDATHSLARGSLTWSKCAALGISIAVAGGFAGWNYGLGVGGWGGMLIAALATGSMFFCLTQAIAELAAAMPEQAGFDSYVRTILGPTAGYLAGVCVALGLTVGTGLALTFTAAYTQGMMGVGGWPVKGLLLAVVFVLHLRGAKEAVGWTMLVGAIAFLILGSFCLFMAPHFHVSNLSTVTTSGASLFPHGFWGVVQCVPFALFMFLGVEQAAQGAAEVQDPTRSMPRALITAILFSFVIGVLVLVVATGVTGAESLSKEDAPLLAAIRAQTAGSLQIVLSQIVGVGALVSFLAAFFGLAYGASRQFHHLASSGALPGWLALTNKKGAPYTALAVVAAVGGETAAFPPDGIMIVFIFLMVLTYEFLLIAFIRFQTVMPDIPRPYRALGGGMAGWLGAALALVSALCCYQLEMAALSYALVALAAFLVYYIWRRERGR